MAYLTSISSSISLSAGAKSRSISTVTFIGFDPAASTEISNLSTILERTLERTYYRAAFSAVEHKVSLCSVVSSGIPSSTASFTSTMMAEKLGLGLLEASFGLLLFGSAFFPLVLPEQCFLYPKALFAQLGLRLLSASLL